MSVLLDFPHLSLIEIPIGIPVGFPIGIPIGFPTGIPNPYFQLSPVWPPAALTPLQQVKFPKLLDDSKGGTGIVA